MHYGIPTPYNGVNYRSIVEAKWAAFFDLAGWKVLYEPIEGRFYIPDFLITSPFRLWIEVKGSTSIDELYAEGDKARRYKDPVTLVGVHPDIRIGDLPLPDNYEDLWKQACNLVQWNREQKNHFKHQLAETPHSVVPRPSLAVKPRPVTASIPNNPVLRPATPTKSKPVCVNR